MDPFQTLRDQSVPTVGYAVLDAPDQRLRQIAIKAQQGQALSDAEVRRLATRQGVELDAASQARASVGFGGAGVPVSTVDFLAGSRLDPRVQQAAAQEAVLASNPTLQQARLQQASDVLHPLDAQLRQIGVNSTGMTDAQKSDALANYSLADRISQQTGKTRDQVLSELTTPVSIQVPNTPAVAQSEDSRPDTELTHDERVSRYAPKVNSSYEDAVAKEALRRFGPITSLFRYSQLRSEMSPEVKEVEFSDPLSGAVYKQRVLQDPRGNIYQTLDKPSYKSGGDRAEAEKQISEWTSSLPRVTTDITRLDNAMGLLKQGGVSGPVVGTIDKIPFVGPLVSQVTAPNMRQVESEVLTVGQNMIKQVFGSNPAEKEAQRLLDRLFDKTQPEKENLRRAAVFRDMIVAGAKLNEQKAQYFARTHTLQGFSDALSSVVQDAASKAGVNTAEQPVAAAISAPPEFTKNAAAYKAKVKAAK